MNNSSINEMEVNKKNGKVRVYSTGTTVIKNTSVASGAILESDALLGKGFQNVVLLDEIPSTETVELRGNYENISSSFNGSLKLSKGTINNIEINGMTKIQLDAGTSIKKISMNIDEEIIVTGPGKVEKIVLSNKEEKEKSNASTSTPGGGSDKEIDEDKEVDQEEEIDKDKEEDKEEEVDKDKEEDKDEEVDKDKEEDKDEGVDKDKEEDKDEGVDEPTNDGFYPLAPAEKKIPKIDESIVTDPSKWATSNTHDAEIIKVGEWYYTFSTDYMVGGDPAKDLDGNVPVRKSKDLINWEFIGHAFEDVPAEAKAWTGANVVWAPDVIELNDAYYLYYCASDFGTRTSFIGVATSKSIEGPWEDQGEVFKTKAGDDNQVNAIDPAIIKDTDGRLWMAYGSYFGGMFISELDSRTGKLKTPSDQGTLIAKRDGSPTSSGKGIEGPAIIYNPETNKYYLTVSYDFLEDTYNVRVARADTITGPYLDYNGNDMRDAQDANGDIGTKIIGSYKFMEDDGWLGTAHNALLKDGDDYFIIHNGRAGANKYWSHLNVRKILWTDDGWPVVSPQRYVGEKEQKISEEHIKGIWETIVLDRTDNTQLAPTTVTLLDNGDINEPNSDSYWRLQGDNTLELYWHDPDNAPEGYWIDTLKVMPGWDWETWNPTLVYTGINQFGTAIWGKRQKDMSDEEAVSRAKETLSLGNTNAVTSHLTLPLYGIGGTTIEWTSNNLEVVDSKGKVYRPVYGEGDTSVTLIAIISRGKLSQTKEFTITVPQMGPDTVVRYSFDEDSGLNIIDSSASKNNAKAIGGVTWTEQGKYEGGIELDGKDAYLLLPPQVMDVEDFTLSTWIYWNGGSSWQRIFDFGDGMTKFMFLTPKGGSGTLQLDVHEEGTGHSLFGKMVLAQKQWSHIAITVEGRVAKLYLNGVLQDTNKDMSIDLQSLMGTENYIGKSRFDGDPYLNATIDDFRIYRRSLSEEEIANIISNDSDILVEAVSIEKELNLKTGQSKTLVPVITPMEATNKKVSWTSNNEGVVTVSNTGRLDAISPGQAVVTVTTEDGDKVDHCTITVIAAQTLEDSIIAKYEFEQSAVDTSHNKNHGTSHGDLGWTSEGKEGGALVLDGSSGYIELPSAVTSSAAITVSTWVYWEGGSDWSRVFDFGGSGGFMYLVPGGPSQKVYFSIFQGGDQTLTASSALPIGEWTHLAVTIEAGTGKLYINGHLEATNENMTYQPIDLESDSNYIGKSRFEDPLFNGKFDDFIVYKRALTPIEIESLVK